MTADQLLRNEFNGYVRLVFNHRPGREVWLGFPTKFYSDEELRRQISVLKDLVLIVAARKDRLK